MYSQPEPGLRSRAPIALAALGWAAAAPALAAEIAVDCGAGGTITEALEKAATGDRITSNTGTGILVDRGSQADVAANDISGIKPKFKYIPFSNTEIDKEKVRSRVRTD